MDNVLDRRDSGCPTHVGIDPILSPIERLSPGMPHTRGDRPYRLPRLVAGKGDAPHTWG